MSKTYKHIGYDDILNISSRSGSPVDRMGNALVPNNLNFEQDGDVLAASFDGSTSIINCGNIDSLIGDKTFITWIKPFSYGELNVGRIVSSPQTHFGMSTNDRIYLTSNNLGATVYTANNAIELFKWNLLCITREADGTANFYINGVLSGAADQDSGTPVVANQINIGDRAGGARAYFGYLEPIIIKPRILSLAEIQQYYTQTRRFYENH